jgi:hypothetical protein
VKICGRSASVTAFFRPSARDTTHLPGDIELVVAHEVGVIALKRIEDEGLIRLRDMRVCEAPLVRQVHLSRDRACVQAGRLRVELQVNGLGGLDTDDELVAGDVLEDTLGDILVLDTDLNLGLVQSWGFAGQTDRGKIRAGARYQPLPAFRMKGTPSHLGL